MTEEEQEYNVPLRDDIAMRTVDFNRSLDVHPSTFTQLTKKLGITLTGAKKTREIFPEDVRTILESKGYKYPRKAKVIVMMVNKGGTGKSTTTFYTSLRLASYGCRVLVIDGDSQGNLTKAFHLDELEMDLDETTPILLDVYKKEIELEGTIIEISPHLHLVPSTPLNGILDKELQANWKNPSKPLKLALKSVEKDYDFVLVDCAPALNATNTSFVCAADEVVLPVNPDPFSEQSLAQTMNDFDEIENDFDIKINRKVLYTRVDQRESSSLKYLGAIADKYPKQISRTMIRTSADVKNAISKNENLFTYPRSTARDDYDDFAKEIMGFNSWASLKKGRRKGARRR